MSGSIRRILALSRLVILDGVRRHALIGLTLFALAGIVGGLVFVDFIPRDIGRATNDFFFSILWLTGLIFLFFHAVQSAAWDSERGTLHTFLARPISRTEYAIAIFFGLAMLLFLVNTILAGLGWGVLKFIKNSVEPIYFPRLSLFSYVLTTLGLYCIQLMILAVILLFSSAVRGGFPVLLLTICYYFICSGLPVVRQAFQQNVNLSQSVHLFLQVLTAIFPNFSILDFKPLVASNVAIPGIVQLAPPFFQAGLYVAIVLVCACSIYQRRDLQ